MNSDGSATYVSPFTVYGVKQFFNTLEEVKKVIHAEAVMEESVAVEAEKHMGFDCIKPNPFKSDGGGHKRETKKLVTLDLGRGLNVIGSSE